MDERRKKAITRKRKSGDGVRERRREFAPFPFTTVKLLITVLCRYICFCTVNIVWTSTWSLFRTASVHTIYCNYVAYLSERFRDRLCAFTKKYPREIGLKSRGSQTQIYLKKFKLDKSNRI